MQVSQFLAYGLRRYLRARWDDLLGSPDGHRRTAVLMKYWLGELTFPLSSELSRDPAGSLTWDEAVLRYGYTAARLHGCYRDWALLARLLLGATLASVIVLVYRLSLGDWAGALASLGTALAPAGIALKPAYRCWLIRTRTLGSARDFLRHPPRWWPPGLPDDYLP